MSKRKRHAEPAVLKREDSVDAELVRELWVVAMKAWSIGKTKVALSIIEIICRVLKEW